MHVIVNLYEIVKYLTNIIKHQILNIVNWKWTEFFGCVNKTFRTYFYTAARAVTQKYLFLMNLVYTVVHQNTVLVDVHILWKQ